MQILTHDVMEILVEFQKINKTKYDILIKDNEIYLRFHSGIMFEAPSAKNGLLDENNLKVNYDILKFIYNLTNQLIKTIENVEI